VPGPDEASVDTDVEMFPEIKEAKVFLDSLMHRVQANTSQEGSGVAAATAAAGRTDRAEARLSSLLAR
jgi:ribosome-binding factor A